MNTRRMRRPRDNVRSRTPPGDHRADMTFEWNGESQSIRAAASARSLRWLFWIIVVLLALTGWPNPAIAMLHGLGLSPLSLPFPEASMTENAPPPMHPAHGAHVSHASPHMRARTHTSCAAGR